MTLSKVLAASLLGVATLSTAALAQGLGKDAICEKFPNSLACTKFKDAPAAETHTPEDPAPEEPAKEEPAAEEPAAEEPAAEEPVAEGPADVKSDPDSGSGSGNCGPNESKAVCYAVAIGGSTTGGNTIAEAAGNAAAYMCGDGEGSATAAATAEATATLFAKAVAEASASCEICGEGSGYADAYAKVTAVAEDWLISYAEAFASASVCNKCDAFAESWVYVEKYVFLKAVAEAKATVDGYASIENGFEFAKTVIDYNEVVKDAVSTAFAEAIANAAIYHDGNQCFAWVNTKGCISEPGAEDPEVCAECVAASVSDSFIYEIPAIAEAGAGAAALTCGPESFAEADVYVFAKALAEATAIAISEVYVSCKADDGAYACADAGTFIEDAAHTVAEAFADSWAVGYDCDDKCVVNAETATTSFKEVLAVAASHAYGSVCVEGGEQWTVEDYKIVVETQLLEAVAKAGAYAISSVNEHGHSDHCAAASFSDTSVTPVPVSAPSP